ncbi:MAG TPA: pentapeptide repeat-containing protein [Actinomycetota bacterium]|nr:pentapeptide repeat-containing protein [Actinomycetota bacterium]
MAKQPPGEVRAEDLGTQISAGEPVNLFGVRVVGELDLTDRSAVDVPLRCIECQLDSIIASDVVFGRIVDLSGSTINGTAQFSASVFRDRALFDGSTFNEAVNFVSSRFASDVSFSESAFNSEALFARVQMDAGALFRGAEFRGGADFTNAQLQGRTTFAKAIFDEPVQQGVDQGGLPRREGASFTGAVFVETAGFVRSKFLTMASFKEAELRSGGNFTFAVFHKGFSMEGVNAAGLLTFKGAQIYAGRGRFLHFTSSGTVSFLGISDGARLSMSNLSATTLLIDPAAVTGAGAAAASKDSVEILKQVEVSARERKDLTRANDAHFELTRIENASRTGVGRVVDTLHRDVFGYLVRPYRPLAFLGLLILFAGLVRSLPGVKSAALSVGEGFKNSSVGVARERSGTRIDVSRELLAPLGVAAPLIALRRSAETQAYKAFSAASAVVGMLWAFRRFDVLKRSRWLVLGIEKAASSVLKGIASATTIAVRRKPAIEIADADRVGDYLGATCRWSEFLAYKVLIGAFLIALGNSNATISQLLSAVIG